MSEKCLGNFMEISQKCPENISRTIPGNFPEMSWKFPGNFPEKGIHKLGSRLGRGTPLVALRNEEIIQTWPLLSTVKWLPSTGKVQIQKVLHPGS